MKMTVMSAFVATVRSVLLAAKLLIMYGMITNDVSDYINLLVRLSHIICNHPLFLVLTFL